MKMIEIMNKNSTYAIYCHRGCYNLVKDGDLIFQSFVYGQVREELGKWTGA